MEPAPAGLVAWSVWPQLRDLASDVTNIVSRWVGRGRVGFLHVVFSFCPQGSCRKRLVIAFITLVEMSQRSSPIFSVTSQPHLSQSEFGRCPGLT